MNLSLRLQWLQVGMLGGFLILATSLFHTQVIRGGYYRRASEHNRIRLIRLEAPRGNIFDRTGLVLAANRPSYHVYLVPEDFDPKDLSELSRLLHLTENQIRERVSESRSGSFTPVLLAEDVPKELALQVEERRPRLAGVFNQVRAARTYPAGEVGAHIVGYIGKISRNEYERLDHSVYYRDSWVGRSGVERMYDLELRGEDGGRQIEVNAKGVPIQLLREKESRPGTDLYLSMDAKLERRIRPLLSGKSVSVLMMDLQTGEILVAASTPGFDPNLFVARRRVGERLALLGSKSQPLVNRGLNGLYPPGSIFKLVTAMAGLEAAVITPHTSFDCPGYFRLSPKSRLFKCWFEGGHGRVDLVTAIERSCNVYFYQTGRLLGERRLAEYSRKFGFGRGVDVGLSLASGVVPDRDWKMKRFQDQWYLGDTISFAIGQGYLLVTPFQILRLVAAIATDGNMIEPKWLRQDREDRRVAERIAVAGDTFRVLRKAMLRVVDSDKGTGQLARVEVTKLAAKTGTAQAPPGAAHAWFGGFFPYEQPRIALVVFVERGESGGVTAAKIAKEIVQVWSRLSSS